MGQASFSYFFHDYETFGTDPKRDRPVQFAGIRTDADFNPIEDPVCFYCRPTDDFLPSPGACLVTGITPQLALREGVSEREFAARIHAELSRPGTCALGYNSLRFDDEFSRFLFYRNFHDVYGREWQHGNSRWDLIDVSRMARALRPDGIQWPCYEDGSPSMRLSDLSQANGIVHENAHDALSDVHATIGLARLLGERQPRLYRHALENRGKRSVARLLEPNPEKPVVHFSGRNPAANGRAAVVRSLGRHPIYQNRMIVFDLGQQPGPLLELSIEEIRARLFVASSDLPPGVERIGLRVIAMNQAPVVAPIGVLDGASAKRLGIDLDRVWAHFEQLECTPDLRRKVQEVYAGGESQGAGGEDDDPETMLYGSLLPREDERVMEQVRVSDSQGLVGLESRFRDPRMPELLFRYRARNYPETLSDKERVRWDDFRRDRLTVARPGGPRTHEDFQVELAELRAGELSVEHSALLDELERYVAGVMAGLPSACA